VDLAGTDTPPVELVVEDIVVGDGAEAGEDSTVEVGYLGLLTDATEFDSSWDGGSPFSFALGGGRDRKEVRDLTGYAAWVSFWNPDTAPHIKRAATFDAVNGLVYYTFLGDELTAEGWTYCQATVQLTDWYIGTAPGRAFLSTSTDIVKIRTMRRPT
jgi:hypothetical protein